MKFFYAPGSVSSTTHTKCVHITDLLTIGIGTKNIQSSFKKANRSSHFLNPDKITVPALIPFDKLGVIYSEFDRTPLGSTQKYHDFLQAVQETYWRYRARGYFGGDPSSSTIKLPDIFKIQLDAEVQAIQEYNQQLHIEGLAGNTDSAQGLRAVADAGDEDAIVRFDDHGSLVSLGSDACSTIEPAQSLPSQSALLPAQHQSAPVESFRAPDVMMGMNVPTGIDFTQFMELTKIAAKLRSEEIHAETRMEEIKANAETARQTRMEEIKAETKRAEQVQVTKRHELDEATKIAQIEADSVVAQAQQLTAQTLAQTKAVKYGRAKSTHVRSYKHQKVLGGQSFGSTLLVTSEEKPDIKPVAPVNDVLSSQLRRLYLSLKTHVVRLYSSKNKSAFTWNVAIKRSKYSHTDFVKVIDLMRDEIEVPLHITSKYSNAPTTLHIQIQLINVSGSVKCRIRKVR